MSDYPMLISNKLHSFRNFREQKYINHLKQYALTAVFCTFAAQKQVPTIKNVCIIQKDYTIKFD